MIFNHTSGLVSVVLVYISYISIVYIGVRFGFCEIYEQYYDLVSGIFIFVVSLSILSHLAAMLIDPGTVTSQTEPLFEGGLNCSICKITKISRTHHCTTCNKCILNMDHHCPWISNCVGFRNQKHFILFLVYTIISGCWFLVTMILTGFYCIDKECEFDKEPIWRFFIVISCCVCLVFVILCLITLKEQVRVVVTNISEIDVLQLRKFKQVICMQRELSENLEEVFGGKFGISWFLPLPNKNKQKPIEVVVDFYGTSRDYLGSMELGV